MKLNFSDNCYREKALTLATDPPQSSRSVTEAFLLLIHDATPVQLANLCARMQKHDPQLTAEECYRQTQTPPDAQTAERIMALAYDCLESGTPLGNELINGKHNSSDWIGHSLLEAKVCGVLARALGLDPAPAQRLGMLHDYGRRCTHTLEHTLRGFELLSGVGWEAEALGCLTHSFLNGGRCANNEIAVPGFFVDEHGFPQWREDAEKDDISDFLSLYRYTDYDTILNIADLMATSREILPPSERLKDIAKRRVLDPTNRGYFLAELTNTLNAMQKRLSGDAGQLTELRAAANVSAEELNSAFEKASECFFAAYEEKRCKR